MSNWNYDNKNKCWYFKEGNIIKKANTGMQVGEFFTDENGDIRRHNSDGTNTKVNVKNNTFYWTQPNGMKVHHPRLKTLDGLSFFDITDEGIKLITLSEGMGVPGYSGYWYKRKKNEGNLQWDGWFIGNGLSETFSPVLNLVYGDPDSNNFTIKELKINGTDYKVAIPNNNIPILDESSLKDIIANSKNNIFDLMRNVNPELYKLITYAPTPVQEALYSLYHLYGANYTNPKNKGKTNKFKKSMYHNDTDKIILALKNKDYKQVAEIIRNYDKTYKTRRNREADYIINHLQLKNE